MMPTTWKAVDNTPVEHLNNFTGNFDDICDQNLDGSVATGDAGPVPAGFIDVFISRRLGQVERGEITSTLFPVQAAQAVMTRTSGAP